MEANILLPDNINNNDLSDGSLEVKSNEEYSDERDFIQSDEEETAMTRD